MYYEWDINDNLIHKFSSDGKDQRPDMYLSTTFKLKSTEGNKYSFTK